MKIILLSRTTLFTVPGGDTIQILKTAESLRLRGCKVDISIELEPDLSKYDLVHVFNLMRPQDVYLQASTAKKHEKKIVLSTIYGPYIEYDKNARGGISGFVAKVMSHSQIEYLKIVTRGVKNSEVHKGTWLLVSKGYSKLQSEIINITDVFLPNSETEMRRVKNDFAGAAHKSYVVIPNAVDAGIFDVDFVKILPEMDKYVGCVLCVARIEGRKNQLNLVRAMRDLPWPLVLIGKAAPNHVGYFEQLKKEAGPNVHIIGHVDHNLLPQFYKAAKVHCLISWMETPGLSSLEAGAMGCNLVITDKGDTRDYFGDYAYYSEPDSVESIRNAIIKAYESPSNPALRQYILQNFTWERAADKTLEAYEIALRS